MLAAEQSGLESEIGALASERQVRERVATRLADEQTAVAVVLARQQAVVDDIDHQISHIEGEIAGLATEEGRIRRLIEFEQSGGGDTPGILRRPVPNGISSGFGYRIHPIYGDRRLHTGWGMNAGCGQPIRAGEGGRVFLAGWNGGYGIAVMIDHGGGMSTLYAHQTRLNVSYGQHVNRGDVVGWVGSTGLSTSCHLHFEVRIGGSPVDPSPYI